MHTRSLGYPHPLAFSLVGALIHENKVENVMIGFLKRLFCSLEPPGVDYRYTAILRKKKKTKTF